MASTLDRIQYTLAVEEAAASSDLVVEAIVENMDSKHTLFKALDKSAPRWVTNLSSLSLSLCPGLISGPPQTVLPSVGKSKTWKLKACS